MAMPPVPDNDLQEAVDLIARFDGNVALAAQSIGVSRTTLQRRMYSARTRGIEPQQKQPARKFQKVSSINLEKEEDELTPFSIPHAPQVASVDGPKWELVSRKDNTYCFGAMGDLHAASKYCRWEVREDLMRRAEKAGAQCIFDTGNWIDGEKPFNRYDIEVSGLDNQVKLLAKNYPKVSIPTYAVTGDDHEGWFIRSEGIDVGRYCEMIMQGAGHKWHDLGYMEADIVLRNANSGATSILRVVHPGGGSAYATSYRPQKIIESYEGGEKPAVVLFGHYHKLDCNNIRNVWCVQTGTQEDQTPFMRKKSLEAHVGGAIIEMEQDPETGAIVSFKPELRRYFNRAHYTNRGLANNRWSGHGTINPIPRRAGQR